MSDTKGQPAESTFEEWWKVRFGKALPDFPYSLASIKMWCEQAWQARGASEYERGRRDGLDRLRELIRAMTFDKCPYCLGSSRNKHNPTCPVAEAIAAAQEPAAPASGTEGRGR